jgi:hypothetical protein
MRRVPNRGRHKKTAFSLWNSAFLIGKLFGFPIAFALQHYSLLP